MNRAANIFSDIQRIREKSPLIHNITNYVVMNNTANALLALGASPVMAHSIDEVEDIVKISSGLVINIGTLSEKWIESMERAMIAANEKNIPVVLDPVGSGATKYRTETSLRLMRIGKPGIIRGNASEIASIKQHMFSITKGVDSSIKSTSAVDEAKGIALDYNCIVVISGDIDIITDGYDVEFVKNGHPMMPKVTGLGCTATALVAAFAAVNGDYLSASLNAMAVMGIAGEITAEISNGPGSFQMNFLDVLYNLSQEQIQEKLK